MNQIKKIFCLIFALIFVCVNTPAVFATDNSRQFSFELTVNGEQTKQAMPGEIITVVLNLNRTDSDEHYNMYAMQNEIRYDNRFFRLVEGSILLSEGINTTDIGIKNNYREFYMNTLSLSGGRRWSAKRLVGSFQLEVIGENGVSRITNQDFKVSTANGQDCYAATCQDLIIVVTTDCTVEFETNGGSKMENVSARYGEILQRPENPEREGYKFVGWYTDIDLQIPWDFDSDTVQGNMTLYAKRQNKNVLVPDTENDTDDSKGQGGMIAVGIAVALGVLLVLLFVLLLTGKKTVKFETACEMQIKDQKVKKGGNIQRPVQPKRVGRTFAGWYTDEARTARWDFETDKVEKDMTLYAKWV